MLNTNRIKELKQEVGEDDFVEVVGIFCEEVEEVLGQLPSTPASAMVEKLHFLKGSALNIGMSDVGELCRSEEERLKAAPGATADIAAIEATYQASKSELIG